MFINYTKKYIFLSVCKTGSTSIQTTLIDNKESDEVAHTSNALPEKTYESFNVPKDYTKGHPNLTEALNLGILTQEQIQEFQIFGVLRDPIDRFVSQAYFSLKNSIDYDVNKVVNEWFRTRESTYSKVDDDINEKKHQTHWLLFNDKPISNIILYEDIDDIIFKITGKKVQLPNHRSDTRKTRNYGGLYNYLRDDIIKEYQDDYDLYMDVKNKKT